MLSWLAGNAATIIISAALLVIVYLIVRGLVRGRIKTCGDCGGECGAGCSACQFHGSCAQSAGKRT